MRANRWISGTTLALTALLASAGAAAAQVTTPDRTEVELQAVRAEAQALAESRDGFLQASILFRRAAEIESDRPDVVQDLVMAGRLAYYVGRKGQAATNLVRAGEAALEWGDVLTSAQAFLDAAWVSYEDGNAERALALASRAERLSHSPLIQRPERMALLSRIADLQD